MSASNTFLKTLVGEWGGGVEERGGERERESERKKERETHKRESEQKYFLVRLHLGVIKTGFKFYNFEHWVLWKNHIFSSS